MESTIHRTEVDLAGLMKVLGQHLYSTPKVVVRELLQNAHDSCVRRRLEGEDPPLPRITVTADPNGRSIHVEDNGAGLTEREIHDYLATVGRGRTRELREGGADELIGFFGLGFLSTYVVAELTEVWTCSHLAPEEAWHYTSRTGQGYTVERAPRREVGTRVSLRLKATYASYSDPATLEALVYRYCCLFPIAIEVQGRTPIGGAPPPWRDEGLSALRRRKRCLELAESFERGFAPLCTLPVGAGEDPSGVNGILWIQDGFTYGSADNRNVSVFVRGMQISDDARRLLPEWATFVGAVIEGNGLVPTASREDLQRDAAFEAAQLEIAESLIQGLAALARDEPPTWRRVLTRHNESLLGASICDARLFELVADQLTVPTSMGDLLVKTVLARSGGTIHVSQAPRPGVEGLMYRARDIPVVLGTRYGALSFCRAYVERHGGELHLIGEQTDAAMLGVERAPETDARLVEWFGNPELEVVAGRFQPSTLPFLPITDRAQELKERIESDRADAAIGAATLALARSFTQGIGRAPKRRLWVNLECPAIAALLRSHTQASIQIGVGLLRSVLGMLAAYDDLGGLPSLDEALTGLSRAMSDIVAAVEVSGGTEHQEKEDR